MMNDDTLIATPQEIKQYKTFSTMKKCKANDDGVFCDEPIVGGGYCRYHQKILGYSKKEWPKMKTHKSKGFRLKQKRYEKTKND